MVAEIVDKHFTENISYYRSLCFKLCRSESALDLLNQTYLELRDSREELILKYHNDNKLKNLVIYRIRDLFKKRNNIKRNVNGNTSQLYVHQKLPTNIPEQTESKFDVTDERLNEVITMCLSNPKYTVPVLIFIQATETSVYELHKKSKMSRWYINKKYLEGKKILQKQLI